jgi:hypothetical protein
LAFLDKFIKFLEGSKAVVIEAKPLKIVAGLEPEKTNAMLRGFGQMAWNHLQAGGKKEEKKEENGGSGGGNGGGSFSYWSMFGNNSAAMSQNTVEHVNSPVLNVPYIPPIAFQSPSP